MPRIRTIKPEFWDSPSTAKAGPWARLLFIALWNWADDYGRGTANLKELEGFAFPNDCAFTDMHGRSANFRALVAEVAACFGVVFYTVDGRPYFEIPTWEEHQRNERRAKQSKYPSSQVADAVAEIPCSDSDAPNISGPGTGEQGNRGTGASSNASSYVARDTARANQAPPPFGSADEQERADDNRHAVIAQRQRHLEARAAAERAEIDDCDLCDDRGYRLGRVCDHDPDADARNAAGIAKVRAALGVPS